MSIKYDHHLLRKVYLFISQSSLYCIALFVLKLQRFDHKTDHLNIIIGRYNCYTVIKISLIYKHQNFIYLFVHINIVICTKLHLLLSANIFRFICQYIGYRLSNIKNCWLSLWAKIFRFIGQYIGYRLSNIKNCWLSLSAKMFRFIGQYIGYRLSNIKNCWLSLSAKIF